MRTIRSGEEVMYRGKRWVVSRIEAGKASSYRLLRTEDDGPRIAWAGPAEINRIDTYVKPVYDTASA
ncbi:MAG TPA: hypothetical protein VK092_03970 [Deinococcales bacterium]|nr:hypothetical protein [Deinococcales bacterium]